MKIYLHIERLVLEGLPVMSAQGPRLQAAIEKELTQLLMANGLSEELQEGATLPHIRAGTIQLGKDDQPARLGQNIARAVHEGIGSSRMEKTSTMRLSKPGSIQQ